MRISRKRRGATLLYVVVTGAGVATVLSGLTGFTAEVSRREGLNEEKATAVAALDGVQELMRWEIRSMVYGGVEVNGYDEAVDTNTAADTATSLPAATAAIRGMAGFTGSVSEKIPTNMVVPAGMTYAESTENVNAFVEGSGDQSKRSERKTMTLDTLYGVLSGATVAEIGSDGLSYNYKRKTVIGVPWTNTTNVPRLKATYYYMKGGLTPHLDSAIGLNGPALASSGMVELELGAHGFPVATDYAIQSSLAHIKLNGTDPQSREIQWWNPGYAGGRTIVKEFERTDTFPVNWENQKVGGATPVEPRLRLIHWTGSFNLAKATDIQGASMLLTTNGDTWVYINGKLAMDLGGLKGLVTSNSIDRRWMQTGANRIDIFYASRRGGYYFGLKTNLMFSPNEPVKILRDSKFDQGWATLTPKLSPMSGVQMLDSKGTTDPDDVDLGIESNLVATTRGVAYNAPTVSGDVGARFTQATATLLLFNTAWGLDLKNTLKVYQRETATDSWRSVNWFATNSLETGSYRRITISTAKGELKEKNFLIAFDGAKLLGLASGSVRIADVAMVTTTLTSSPTLFLPPYEEKADSYALVAGSKIEVERQTDVDGSVWGGDDLKLYSAPMSISKDLFLVGEVRKQGSLLLTVLNILGISTTSSRPPGFVLDAGAYDSRANLRCSGGTVSALAVPSGHSAVNLYSDNSLTLSNLSIPSGGTIYAKGSLTIYGGITMDAGKELYLIADGGVIIDAPVATSTAADYSRIHIIASQDVQFKRPVNWNGTVRTNGKMQFKAKSTMRYVAPSMSPPGVATTG
ncbi:MAG: hypothetical protein KF812_03750 [Fimbriimonadaceae bacterium]|nr:hypothetical protein [Fimbriimonadaceae bacterium]